LRAQLDATEEIAWQTCHGGHKPPRTRKAGPDITDPDYDLSIDWLGARAAIAPVQRTHDDPAAGRQRP
jgi:hypothetical protein